MNLKWDKCIIWGTTPLWSCFSLYFNCFQGFWTFLVDGCCADRPTDKVLLLKSYLFWKSPSICCLRRSRENREVKRKKEKRGGRCEVEKEEKCIYCKHNFYQNLQSCFAIPRTNWRWWRKQGFRKLISEGTTSLSSPLTTGYSRWTQESQHSIIKRSHQHPTICFLKKHRNKHFRRLPRWFSHMCLESPPNKGGNQQKLILLPDSFLSIFEWSNI